MKRALTVAGSDSGGGAGIQADLKTFGALGVFGTSAITAVTAQNTVGVTRIQTIDPDVVAAQIDAVAQDIGFDSVKTGMLASTAIVEAVAAALKKFRAPNLVVDPVMVSKSGTRLLDEDAVTTMKARLLPLAELGPRRVVIKGGHAEGPNVVDLYYDGERFEEFKAERVVTRSTHGTGCTYSAAIAAYLAHGLPPLDAVARAKEFLIAALQTAPDIGTGIGPVNHFHAFHKA